MAEAAWHADKTQLVSWVLNFLAVMALALGSWFFSGLTSNIDKLSETINALQTQVAVLAADNKRVFEIRDDFRAHIEQQGHHTTVALIERLRAELDVLDSAIDEHTNNRGHPVLEHEVAQLQARLAPIEATRFTARDADNMQKAIDALSRRVAELERK